MSEVPLYKRGGGVAVCQRWEGRDFVFWTGLVRGGVGARAVQGYLAHKNTTPRRTLQKPYA